MKPYIPPFHSRSLNQWTLEEQIINALRYSNHENSLMYSFEDHGSWHCNINHRPASQFRQQFETQTIITRSCIHSKMAHYVINWSGGYFITLKYSPEARITIWVAFSLTHSIWTRSLFYFLSPSGPTTDGQYWYTSIKQKQRNFIKIILYTLDY